MITRRDFLKNSTTAAVGGMIAGSLLSRASAAPVPSDRILKVGLIGCGGRGAGAAAQALQADPQVRLTAMGDAFADHLEDSLAILRRKFPDTVNVTPQTSFVGIDAYQKVIDSGVDVVLLAAPPAFRPEHLRASVAAGKHIFCEKPVAVDSTGVRSVFATVAEAKRKKLSLVSGFCWRYDDRMRATVREIHAGAIGKIQAIYATYHTNTLSTKFTGERKAGWTDLEWQLRNWYNFTWLSGDHYVEQAIHNVDKIAWLMNGAMPVQAIGVGGRQIPAYGDTFDHYSVGYEYADGSRAQLSARQMDGTYKEVTDYVMGTKGVFSNGRGLTEGITGEKNWKYTGPSRLMYQVEHDELFASIRSGQPINDGEWMTNSTLMGIMGRMAVYTGQAVSWEQALNSRESLVPEKIDWQMPLAVSPRPVPGKTKLI